MEQLTAEIPTEKRAPVVTKSTRLWLLFLDFEKVMSMLIPPVTRLIFDFLLNDLGNSSGMRDMRACRALSEERATLCSSRPRYTTRQLSPRALQWNRDHLDEAGKQAHQFIEREEGRYERENHWEVCRCHGQR